MNLQKLNDIIIDAVRREKFVLTYIDGDNYTANFVHRDNVNISIQFTELADRRGFLASGFKEKYSIKEVNRGMIKFLYNGQVVFIEECYVATFGDDFDSAVLPKDISLYNEIEEEKDILFEMLNKHLMFNCSVYDDILDEEGYEISVNEWSLI